MSASAVTTSDPAIRVEPVAGRRPTLELVRSACRQGRTRVGLVLIGLIVAIALIGPLVAPHSPTEFVAVPNAAPSGSALLGADQLGRDVLSRFLHGGWSVIWLSAAATALGILLGASIGLYAAYARGWVDDVLMRLLDVVLAFPAVVLALLAISAIGPKLWLVVVMVAVTGVPYDARLLRAAAQEVLERDFVRAAEAAGERPSRILLLEVLPNVTGQLMVAIGLRMTYSIVIIASLSFLGFGLQPPSADWGLMINENRIALTVQPWSVLVPAIAIGLFTVGFNLVTDGIARAAAGIDRGVHE